jgi:hypothetical protein
VDKLLKAPGRGLGGGVGRGGGPPPGPAPPPAPAAPPTAAVSPPPTAPPSLPVTLQEHVGRNVAYRLSIPTGWNVTSHGEQMEAANGSLLVILVAANAREIGAEPSLKLSPSELQALSGAAAPPESALLKLADGFARALEQRPGSRCTQLSREVRVMAGQRAGFSSLECVLAGGNTVRFEARAIVKDRVLYALMAMGEVAEFDANELLFDRIRESLVLAPAPQGRARE